MGRQISTEKRVLKAERPACVPRRSFGSFVFRVQLRTVVSFFPSGPSGPAGESGDESEQWLVAPALLHAGQVVTDLVYAPRPTPWLAASAAAGATTVDGLGMLVHQAALQLELWTGQEAPVDVMWQAATAHP